MKKTFVQTILLLMPGLLFAAAISLPIFAVSKNRTDINFNSKLKRFPKSDTTKEVKSELRQNALPLPVLFEENKGQFGENIKF